MTSPPTKPPATPPQSSATVKVRRPPSPLQNLLELSRRARHAGDAVTLQFILVNETYSLTPFTTAMLWVENEGLVSISGVSQLDRHSAFNLWLAKLCESFSEQHAAPVRITPDLLSPEDTAEWSQALPGSALWIPADQSLSQTELPRFGLLLARDQVWTDEEIALLTEWVDIWRHAWQKMHAPGLQSELSKGLRAARQVMPGAGQAGTFIADVFRGLGQVIRNPFLLVRIFTYPLLMASRGLVWFGRHGLSGTKTALADGIRNIWSNKRRRYTWLFWIAVFFPVKLTVLAPAELVPANPAMIRVPIEGVVDEFFVTPNQKVVEGQPLFKLDLTSLTSRLQIAQQETQIASTELRQSTLQSLSDAKSRRLIAPQEGKAAERRLEAEYLKELLSKAQIKSPRAGVVLFDDPSEWIGRPVVAGEKVMVVANEGDVEIEAWIALSDAIDLPNGAPVTLYLNAAPLSPVDGQLRYLGHEAIQRPDGTYAYRLRATLNPGEPGGRVGSKGTARVSGQIVPLSYWVFRKPISWLRQFVGI